MFDRFRSLVWHLKKYRSRGFEQGFEMINQVLIEEHGIQWPAFAEWKKCMLGLMDMDLFFDFVLKRKIGGVRYQQVKRAMGAKNFKSCGWGWGGKDLKPGLAIGPEMLFKISFRQFDCVGIQLRGETRASREMIEDLTANDPGTKTKFGKPEIRSKFPRNEVVNCFIHENFCFRPWDQCGRVDLVFMRIKKLITQKVLQGNTLGSVLGDVKRLQGLGCIRGRTMSTQVAWFSE